MTRPCRTSSGPGLGTGSDKVDRSDSHHVRRYLLIQQVKTNVAIVNFDPSPYIRIAIHGHTCVHTLTLCYYTCIVNSYIFSLLLLCCYCCFCLPSEQRRQHHSPSGCVSTPTQLLQKKEIGRITIIIFEVNHPPIPVHQQSS